MFPTFTLLSRIVNTIENVSSLLQPGMYYTDFEAATITKHDFGT